jgi:hypothetical protein
VNPSQLDVNVPIWGPEMTLNEVINVLNVDNILFISKYLIIEDLGINLTITVQ